MSRWHITEFDHLPELAFRSLGGRMRLEGGGGKGGGSSAPAPDPRLVEAQIKSLGVQDSAIQGIMDLQKKMQPIQEEQMRFGLESGKTAFEQSQADREYALERRSKLTGIQDLMISEAKDFNTEARQNEIAAQAGADVAQSFSASRDQSGRAMARMGINPNSGKFAAIDGQMSVAQAAASAGASNMARTAARSEGRALQDRAAGTLAGYPTMGMQTTGAGAQFAANGINMANSGANGMSAGFSSAAGIAGNMGSNATGMWNAQAGYKTRQDDANQGESMGSILGGLGGAAAGAVKLHQLLASDRRLKEDITLVDKDARTGLNLYEFRYLNDESGKRYRGVMADEVAKVDSEAVQYNEAGYAMVDYGRLGLSMQEV